MTMRPGIPSMGSVLALVLVCGLAAASPEHGERTDLSGVRSWAAQLQDTNIDELVASPYDLLTSSPNPDPRVVHLFWCMEGDRGCPGSATRTIRSRTP